MPRESVNIIWFRRDLRVQDNPALEQALTRDNILALYIYDDIDCIGEASKWWLHHSLVNLNNTLKGKLNIYQGNALNIFKTLSEEYTINNIHWNRCYEPQSIKRDTAIKEYFKEQGINAQSHNGSLLFEPWQIQNKTGSPYKVFTPFFKACLNCDTQPRIPINITLNTNKLTKANNSLDINNLKLLPAINWTDGLTNKWSIGEEYAQNKLQIFLKNKISNYKIGRDFPAQNDVSELSAYLHFGEISPNQVWYQTKELTQDKNTECFLKELCWREFSHSLLYYFPELDHKNWQSQFDKFPWQNNQELFTAWKQGKTGIPIVDAGMRELWQTGYMHNRVRMVVASFLVKNLLIPWQEGAKYFWDCLVDADMANNSASWQWVAGCGVDASPYFRIFNPVTQGQKFDPTGEYIKQYVPELETLHGKYLYCPWEAPDYILKNSNITLGTDYPLPIVDLKQSRESALEAYKQIKN